MNLGNRLDKDDVLSDSNNLEIIAQRAVDANEYMNESYTMTHEWLTKLRGVYSSATKRVEKLQNTKNDMIQPVYDPDYEL